MTFNKTALALVVLGGICGQAAAQTNDQIDAQIREFEKGAAESAIKYKDEHIRPARPTMMFDGDGVYQTCGVTMSHFMEIKSGMSYETVAAVLGCDGIPTSESNSGGYSGAIYGWQGAASRGANMSVQFQSGRMINKSQSGLR